jgi:hypothetical protein
MRTEQISKLYSKLTPQEQATLAFEAAVLSDGNEVDAIMEQVHRETYRTVHADYHRRAFGLMSLVGTYGTEYWKNRALLFMACDHSEQSSANANATALQFLVRTLALEAAIIDVCKRRNVDVAAIKKMADCALDKVKREKLTDVDPELIQHYVELFEGCFCEL